MKCTAKTDSYASYLFCQGTNTEAYRYLGSHMTVTEDGKYLYTFRVWAPHADAVYAVGDFNGWDDSLPMEKEVSSGIWSVGAVFDSSHAGDRYKYKISSCGRTFLKADPYANYAECLGNTASILWDDPDFTWHDGDWKKKKHEFFTDKDPKNPHFYSAPMNIYEVHLASWKTREGKSNTDGLHYLNYREIADEMAPYLLEMHYTHVELMPVMEYPYDGSWGYQVCGYYAPTSRFGTPDDFKYFVDTMHQNGIGVILDWVPAHFPKDAHGLYEFDGTLLYEYQGKDRMENENWGTRYFDVGRPEVQSFLISNALYWLKEFHADGLRVDAVASMLYLDYDRKPGEWVENIYGNNQNLEAIAFFRKLNAILFGTCPDTLMIAEESTAWPMITKPVYAGGLGFNFKWNMGFANDMFDYIASDPIYRQYKHEKLTFPMVYAYTENFILPVSHDEVVHGKKSLIDKMFGSYDEKFATMRVYMTFMMTLPGKKLLFMGTEFAQFREWDYENPLEWFMLDYPRHAEMQRCIRELNRLYLTEPSLHEIDDGWDGFSWLNCDDRDHNTVSYRRMALDGDELITVCNFSPAKWENYILPVPKRGEYTEVFTTDACMYGGSGYTAGTVKSKCHKENGRMKNELLLTIPPYTAMIFRRKQEIRKTKKKK